MVDAAEIKSAVTAGSVGMWISPGLGNAYPELIVLLDRLYRDRVATLPWVPGSWYDQVQKLQNADRTNLIRPTPAVAYGRNLPNVPDWIAADQARRDAWQQIVDKSNQIISQYAAGQAEAARPELERLYADAAFWNSPLMRAASAVQETLIAAPTAIGNAAGQLASGLFGSFLKRAWWVVVLVVVGYVVWVNRGAMAKAAPGVAKKAAKAVGDKMRDYSKPLSDPVK